MNHESSLMISLWTFLPFLTVVFCHLNKTMTQILFTKLLPELNEISFVVVREHHVKRYEKLSILRFLRSCFVMFCSPK